jgi:hypothetical protein
MAHLGPPPSVIDTGHTKSQSSSESGNGQDKNVGRPSWGEKSRSVIGVTWETSPVFV